MSSGIAGIAFVPKLGIPITALYAHMNILIHQCMEKWWKGIRTKEGKAAYRIVHGQSGLVCVIHQLGEFADGSRCFWPEESEDAERGHFQRKISVLVSTGKICGFRILNPLDQKGNGISSDLTDCLTGWIPNPLPVLEGGTHPLTQSFAFVLGLAGIGLPGFIQKERHYCHGQQCTTHPRSSLRVLLHKQTVLNFGGERKES